MLITETNIVQSAISAFNNAALVSPAFLWLAILMLPIFIIAWKYGNTFLESITWKRQNILSHICIWTVGLTLLWVILFGGNYSILRDVHTLLPFVTALILFLSSFFIGTHREKFKIPQILLQNKATKICGIIVALVIIGLTDIHTWWGPILQIVAVCLGLFLGIKRKSKPNDMFLTAILMATTVIAILMQPEFFRFGQLGNLGTFHLLGILVFGLGISATFALNKVRPVNKFRQSVFIKLKWLSRVLSILGIVTFLLTESVPMFIFTLVMAYITFTLSIKHSKLLPTNLGSLAFGATIFMFGILTTMPVICCLGLFQILYSKQNNTWHDFKFLL